MKGTQMEGFYAFKICKICLKKLQNKAFKKLSKEGIFSMTCVIQHMTHCTNITQYPSLIICMIHWSKLMFLRKTVIHVFPLLLLSLPLRNSLLVSLLNTLPIHVTNIFYHFFSTVLTFVY